MSQATSETSDLKAPFPYMGGKSYVAPIIWRALWNVTNYVEPFAGSAAVLLARPQPFSGTETINDANGFVSNFWRAVSKDADEVARHADHPVLENDVHARHRWLWERHDSLCESLEADPEWFDAKIAGWWVWGMGVFMPGAWCVGRPRRCKPMCAGHNHGQGVHGVSREIVPWMRSLQMRLRRVRVLCGDYKCSIAPIVLSSMRAPSGTCGVFADPPYSHEGRDKQCYGELDDSKVFDDVIEWAIGAANDHTRIVVAGYDSRPMPRGWREIPWRGHGGRGRVSENQNHHRERLWLSPACIGPEDERQPSLFGGAP